MTNVIKRVGNEFHWKINDELTIKYETKFDQNAKDGLVIETSADV